MNIKTLLLGSAAALAAVSGAHAADAIVAAEPEPLEYVRICDAYGKGYFYIPGTETCLQIGGKVRSDVNWGDVYQGNTKPYKEGTHWLTRAELNINTATDSEYGPLKTATVLRFDFSEGVNSTNAPLIAYISLGGFLIGRQDSQYNDWIGYAGDVINDDVIGDGPYELNQLSYLYDSGTGFTGVISIEDSNSGSANPDSANHYAPDGVAGLGYKSGAWSFKIVGGYDSIVEEGAIKARIDADFGSFSAFVMGAWNTDGDKVNKYANGDATGSTGDWTVWGGWSVPFNEKLKWSSQVAYADNKTFEATTNLQFHPVKDLLIMPEVSYVNYDSINQDRWEGIVRFQRSF